MTVWQLILLIYGVGLCVGVVAGGYHATPSFLVHVDEMPQLAQVSGAGAHRGPHWYDDDSSKAENTDSSVRSGTSEGDSIKTDTRSSERSSGASSLETLEKHLATRVYRECTPCPLDMIRKHTNIGIKWICGAYQRARRSFKSECMMRFRNCQDGTMFIKISDHRCKENAYHGRHWFYIYKV